MESACRFRVDLKQSLLFAQLSGDYNPVHISDLAARRTMFGTPIVHGMSLVLRILELATNLRSDNTRFANLKCTFHKSLAVGEMACCELTLEQDGTFLGKITTLEGNKVANLRGRLETETDSAALPHHKWEEALPGTFDARELDFQGSEQLGFDDKLLARVFPGLAQFFSPKQIGVLLGMTRIVGMHCPGLHSVFSSFQVSNATGPVANELSWRIKSFHSGFGLISLGFESGELEATIEAFLRPQPVLQPQLIDLSPFALPKRLSGRRVLVIGGSRGLGEVCAKLVALEGAECVVGYHRGVQEAGQVVREITSFGLSASMREMNVLAPDSLDIEDLRRMDGIIFCASPPIRAGSGGFDREAFNFLSDFFVSGMANVIERAIGDHPLAFAIPSTVFIDSPEVGFEAYAASKAAAETLGDALASHRPMLRFSAPRLPRVLTDQTNGISSVPTSDIKEAAAILVGSLSFT